jgi:hypothetical protein
MLRYDGRCGLWTSLLRAAADSSLEKGETKRMRCVSACGSRPEAGGLQIDIDPG